MTTALRISGKSNRALSRRINFTVEALARLTCPDGKDRLYVFDTKTPNLAVAVTPTDSKTFYLVRKIHGRKERVRIGGMEITVEQARKLAAKLNGTIAEGADPLAAKRALRESETLQELFDRYAAELRVRGASERTLMTDKSRFDTCLDGLAGRRILSLHEGDIRQVHQQIGKDRGHVSANRAVQLLRRVFNFGRIEPNPVRRGSVNLFIERSRERFLSGDELRRLFAALEHQEVNQDIADFIRVALFTGARRNNVAAMQLSEINLPNRTWTIPAGKSKNGEAIRVHLSDPAMKIIARRCDHASGFIFPGPGKTGHLIESKWTWAKVLKIADLKDVRLHDLRRTLGSWQAALGASLSVIGKSLGHRDPSATKIHARLDLAAVRRSVDEAASAMVAAANSLAE
jgi:integrase